MAVAERAGPTNLAQRNLIAFNRALTRWSTRGALQEDGRAVLCAGGTWIPVVANGAYREDDSMPGDELIARADAFFGAMARGYSIKVRDNGQDEDLRAACLAAGLDAFGDATPEMLCPSPLPDGDLPVGVEVRWVDDEAGLRDFLAVNAVAYATYGMPGEVIGDLFDATCSRARRRGGAPRGGPPRRGAAGRCDGLRERRRRQRAVGGHPPGRAPHRLGRARSPPSSPTSPSRAARRRCRCRPHRWGRRSISPSATRRSGTTRSTCAGRSQRRAEGLPLPAVRSRWRAGARAAAVQNASRPRT